VHSDGDRDQRLQRLLRQPRVEHLLRDVGERVQAVGSRPGVRVVELPQPRQPGALGRSEVEARGRRDRFRDEVGAAQLGGQLGGAQQPHAAPERVGGEARGAIERRERDVGRPAPLGSFGRGLEVGGQAVIGPRRACDAVPDLPVGLRGQRGGERGMGSVPLRERRGLIDRRPHQRMAEAHGVAVRVDESRGDGRREVRDGEGAPGDRRPGLQRFRERVVVVGRGDEQERAGSGRQPGLPLGERALQPRGERHQRGARRRRVVSRRPRQLGQGERVAARGLEDARPPGFIELRRDAVEQLGGGSVVKRAEPLLRPAGLGQGRWTLGGGRVAVAERRDHRDPVVTEAARDEREDVGGRAVEPVCVVGQEHERGMARGLAEQLERGKRDEERIRCGVVGHPEGTEERVALRAWKRSDVREDRAEQGMEPGERQARLRLDRAGPEHEHAAVAGDRGDRVEQRGLANPCRPAHEQRTAGVEKNRDALELGLASGQLLLAHERQP
jgi:hypothetical protein